MTVKAPLALLAVATAMGTGYAQDQAWTGTASAAWSSAYLFRGEKLAGSSFQPYLEGDGHGFSGGVWGNASGQQNEADIYLSYTDNLSPSLSLQPGATYYAVNRPGGRVPYDASTADRFEPNLALNYTTAPLADSVGPLRFSPKIYADLTRHQLTVELNSTLAVPLRSIGTELDFGATVGTFGSYQAPAPGVDRPSAGYYLAQVTLPYQLPHHLRASLAYGYEAAFSATDVPLAASQGFVTASLSYSF